MSKKKGKPRQAARGARSGHGRQRQHLIDACISALHLYGPSRTTVEKVVAIADMSPGIVRFYFDSKAAMLVASLQFLSDEFEERVLTPVAGLKNTPVAALELLVDLYLDPEIASARKVSVWYSFWGEASSRQEYYDICGQKDERFAALLLDLIGRMIGESGQPQLDPDGISLGLIGVLEMLWQGFAFQTETAIDRAAAKHRCMAYLRSVFPGRFALNRAGAADAHAPARSPGALPGWSYQNARLNAVERETLFPGSWQFACHESRLPNAGDYAAIDLCVERALILRDATGALRAFRNSCPAQPHVLVAQGAGSLINEDIVCRAHGLRFALDGSALGRVERLHALQIDATGGLIFLRSGAGTNASANPWVTDAGPLAVMHLGASGEQLIAANWKLVVEQLLEISMPASDDVADAEIWSSVALAAGGTSDRLAWSGELNAATRRWSVARYQAILGADAAVAWRRIFMPPNQLLEIRPDGVTLLQILPVDAGLSRLLRHTASTMSPSARAAAAADHLAQRLSPCVRGMGTALIESIQRGIVNFGYEPTPTRATAGAALLFRAWVVGRIPALAYAKPPADWR